MDKKAIEILENCKLEDDYFSEKGWVCPLNFHPEVISQLNIPKKVIIHDVTLRDGEQTAGVAFTTDEKVFLAEELDKIGIPLLEIGFGAVEKDRETFKRLSKMNLNAKMLACTRIMEEDVKQAIDCGADGLFLETAINPYVVKHVFGFKNTEEFIDQIVKCGEIANRAGLFIDFCAWDTFRNSNLEYIKGVYEEVTKRIKVDQIGISDTFGQAHPLTMQFMVKKMKEWIPDIPLSIHGHNDFGLTGANALMAVTSGADAVECAFNGLGERAGNIATEEIISELEILMGIDTGVNYKELYRISKLVSEISKVPVAKTKAIVGSGIFNSESGIVIDIALKLKNKLGIDYGMQPYSPEAFSRNLSFVGGVGSGKAYVKYKLEEFGLKATDEQVKEIVLKVKTRGAIIKSALMDDELRKIIEEITGKA